jgi:uncharacterized protein YbaP (TraB family)
MKRLGAVFSALMLAFAAPASARTPIAPNAEQAVNPALFVIRDEDSTMYLFGTVHVRRPGSAWGGANAQAALAEADEIWTEVEMTEDANTRLAQLMLQYGMAPEGEPLSAILNEDERTRLARTLQRYGIPVERFERMRPWLAAIMLSVMPMIQAGYDPNAGVDQAIDAFGDANGKRMRAFETMEQQIGFLANMSPEVQRQMLIESISEGSKDASDLDSMSDEWARGDIEALERSVVDETRTQFPEVYDVLFVQRNNAWIEVLVRELDGSGVDFVAVGAGHLLGEHGLVEQLRARGLNVERVSPAE